MEIAGLALSGVSLSFQVFGGCVKGFVLLSGAHNLGKDASLLRTMLNLEEYRFVQWASAVGLLAGPPPEINERLNQALAADLMGQLEQLLSINKLRDRYKLELVTDKPATAVASLPKEDSSDAGGILRRAVSDDMRGEILARAKLIQSKSHLPKRLWWAAIDKKRFEALVEDVRQLVNGLWTLLDPVQQTDLMSLMRKVLTTVIQVSEDVGELRALQGGLESSNVSSRKDVGEMAIAAGLKALRVEINDPDPTSIKHPQMAQAGPDASTGHSRSSETPNLESLKPNLLKDFIASSSNPAVGSGLYEGVPVYVEHKSVPQKLKSKMSSRVRNLALLLSKPQDPSFFTLQCLGFFEDGERFVFLYKYPDEALMGTDPCCPGAPKSLLDLLRDSTIRSPSATTRLAIALNLCRTILTLHTAGWLHKDLRSENILFFSQAYPNESAAFWSRPYLTGFAFSRYDTPDAISEHPSADPQRDIYRHPNALGEPSTSFQKHMDLYSLGTILVEIAEWKALKRLVVKCVDVSKPEKEVPLSAIAAIPRWLLEKEVENGEAKFRMGDVYGEAIARCLKYGTEMEAEDSLSDLLVMVKSLQQCHI